MTNAKPNPKELLKQVNANMYRDAYAQGENLSVYLEKRYGSPEYKDGLDTFERLLMVAGIRTHTLKGAGVRASTYGDFAKNPETRGLVPEFLRRTWTRAATGKPASTRGIFASNDGALGGWEHPYQDAQDARTEKQLSPAIPLDALVALSTGIGSDAYRAFYLDNTDSAKLRLGRVNEGATVPEVKLVGGDNTITLKKYGRSLRATYEQLRRMPLDKISLIIQQLAVQSETDKVADALDVVINGDGNNNAASSYNLTALDTGATAGTLTLKGWLAFKLKFASPYMVTAAIVQEETALQLLMLNTGSANTPLAGVTGVGGFTQINAGLRDNVALGWTSDAPALKIVGIDTRMAIEHVFEIGADITEVERFTNNQTETLTMTELDGFAVLDKFATKILDVNA